MVVRTESALRDRENVKRARLAVLKMNFFIKGISPLISRGTLSRSNSLANANSERAAEPAGTLAHMFGNIDATLWSSKAC
jgi:hypothetical protein